ncbi:MAG: hypothetical protein R3A51_10500 [Nannocystaceae bacterium]
MATALGLPTRVVIDEGAFAALKLHADALEILGILRAGLEAGDARIIDLTGSSGTLELRVHHCGDHTKVLRWERTRDSYTVVAGWEFRGASLRPIVAPDGGYGFGEVSDARGTGGPWRVRLDLEAAVGEAERFLLGLGCFKLDRYARVEKNESTASAQRGSVEVPACDESPHEASALETLKAQLEAAISSATSELGTEEHALGSANEPAREEPTPVPSQANNDEPIYAVAAAAAGMSGWLDLHESWIALAGGSIDIAELAGHHARLWRERLKPLVGRDTTHRTPGPILCAYEALELTVRATPERPIPGDVRRVFNSIVGAQIRMLAELLDEFGAQSTEK